MKKATDLIEDAKQFALNHYQREIEEAVVECARVRGGPVAPGLVNDPFLRGMVLGEFTFSEELPTGSRVLDLFARTLTGEDRELVLGWRDSVSGTFEVVTIRPDRMIVRSVFDDLDYPVLLPPDLPLPPRLRPGWLLTGLVVAVPDGWLFTYNPMMTLPADRQPLIDAAAVKAIKSPELMFRNPEKLAAARAAVNAHREAFLEHFGDELVIIAGSELLSRLTEYRRSEQQQIRAGRLQQLVVRLSVPPDLDQMRSAALHFAEGEGMYVYRDYGLLEDAFTYPELVARRAHRDTLTHYLRTDWLSPIPLRRLADRDPDRATQVLRTLLNRPSFSWPRDGETLLRHHKPTFYDSSRPPRMLLLTGTLAQADSTSEAFHTALSTFRNG
ncbi:hypothetical protein GCM10027589_03680 [Actinocorallia lasiicapitis]